MSEPVMSRPTHKSGGLPVGSIAALCLLVALGYGVYTHVERGVAVRALAQERENQIPDVRTTIVHATMAPVALDLPGETVGLETATINARASGYIDKRFVDIGATVKAGQPLAIIRAPELDQRVAQAQAALAQAKATLEIARVTARRSGGLVGGGAVSKQSFDVDQLTRQQREAEQAAANAVLAEMAQRRAYTTLVAPFDGVVTVRNVEAGDLVSADTAQGMPLFTVARTDRLRVRVHVPQDQARSVHVGDPASIIVPERPGEHFTGTVTRTSEALEQNSRMLLVEIELDNRDGRLSAGVYASIHFNLPRQSSTIIVPAEAVAYEADGLSVETVGPDNKVTVRKVQVGRDYGDTIEILNGLPDGSQLIVHPPSALHQGSQVAPRPDADGKGA